MSANPPGDQKIDTSKVPTPPPPGTEDPPVETNGQHQTFDEPVRVD
jgi:hypothetical protein